MNNRQIIRQSIRLQRLQLSSASATRASLELSYYIANTLWFRRSKRIAFYHALPGEIDPCYLIQQAWELRKICYLPICHPLNQQTLLFAPYYPNDSLKYNRYGILEPNINTRSLCKPFALDLVFTPLLAFDKQGNRLGSGKGYYDRTFAYLNRATSKLKPLLVGLAYQFQEVSQLPVESWDIPMDKVIVVDTKHG